MATPQQQLQHQQLLYQQLQRQLARIESLLKAHGQWQSVAPTASALDSLQPFCLDTLQPCEWLQWIFLPRMRALMAAQQPLPQACAITPYYDYTLSENQPLRTVLLPVLAATDRLFTG